MAAAVQAIIESFFWRLVPATVREKVAETVWHTEDGPRRDANHANPVGAALLWWAEEAGTPKRDRAGLVPTWTEARKFLEKVVDVALTDDDWAALRSDFREQSLMWDTGNLSEDALREEMGLSPAQRAAFNQAMSAQDLALFEQFKAWRAYQDDIAAGVDSPSPLVRQGTAAKVQSDEKFGKIDPGAFSAGVDREEETPEEYADRMRRRQEAAALGSTARA